MSSFFSSIKKAIGIDSNTSDNDNYNVDDNDIKNINVHNDVNNYNNDNKNSHIPSITTNNNDVYDVYDITFTEDKLGLGLDRYHGLIPIIDNSFILNNCNNNNCSSSIDKVDHSDNTHYQQPGNSYSATCPVVKTVDPNFQGFQKSKNSINFIYHLIYHLLYLLTHSSSHFIY
jgi:hypothetical protein